MGDRALLVIGVGNRDRGDDAAGPVVCDLVASAGLARVDTLVFEGSVLDLPMHWEPEDVVVLVDAAAPTGHPGRVTRVDAVAHHVRPPSAASTHAIDVGSAVELARVLGRLPAELSIVGIEGVSFEFGDPLHPAVRRAAACVAAMITRRAAREPAGA
jgi:hydrogenase maturation protease